MQKTHSSCASALSMYSRRHGAQSCLLMGGFYHRTSDATRRPGGHLTRLGVPLPSDVWRPNRTFGLPDLDLMLGWREAAWASTQCTKPTDKGRGGGDGRGPD